LPADLFDDWVIEIDNKSITNRPDLWGHYGIAREIAAMYLANKVQNIRGSADTLLEKAGLSFDEIAPIAEAMEKGGRKAAARAVTDAVLEKVRPIAGTPEDCLARIEESLKRGGPISL